MGTVNEINAKKDYSKSKLSIKAGGFVLGNTNLRGYLNNWRS
jgi:hypothetical protein